MVLSKLLFFICRRTRNSLLDVWPHRVCIRAYFSMPVPSVGLMFHHMTDQGTSAWVKRAVQHNWKGRKQRLKGTIGTEGRRERELIAQHNPIVLQLVGDSQCVSYASIWFTRCCAGCFSLTKSTASLLVNDWCLLTSFLEVGGATRFLSGHWRFY